MAELHNTSNIRTQVLKDTGFDGDDFAGTAAEMNLRILRSVRSLHWEVIRCVGENGYLSATNFTTVANQAIYPLPADFEQLREALGSRQTVGVYDRLLPLEQGALVDVYNNTTPGVEWPPYILTTFDAATPVEQFEFVQQPPIGRRVVISYVRGPLFTPVGGTEYNFRLPPGGLEYVINDVAASLLTREQNENADFIGRRSEALDTVRKLSLMRGGPSAKVPRRGSYYDRVAYLAPGVRR